jgi:hypothetical protein
MFSKQQGGGHSVRWMHCVRWCHAGYAAEPAPPHCGCCTSCTGGCWDCRVPTGYPQHVAAGRFVARGAVVALEGRDQGAGEGRAVVVQALEEHLPAQEVRRLPDPELSAIHVLAGSPPQLVPLAGAASANRVARMLSGGPLGANGGMLVMLRVAQQPLGHRLCCM